MSSFGSQVYVSLPVYEGFDMACQVDMVGEALVVRDHIIEKQQAKLDTMLLADKKLALLFTLALLFKEQKVKHACLHRLNQLIPHHVLHYFHYFDLE